MKRTFLLLLLSALIQLDGKEIEDPLRQKALAGDHQAMVSLGDDFFRGANRPRNFSLAAFWYRKAAASGYPLGNYRYAVCLEYGCGVSKSPRLAFEHYQKAGALEAARLRIAEMLLEGIPGEKDFREIPADREKAIEILRILCKKNYFPAFSLLAKILYETPESRKLNGKEIYQLVLKSSESGNPSPAVLTFQAKLLQEGVGVRKDPVFARALLEIAARKNYPEAEFMFAEALEFGRGTAVAPQKAFEYYRKSAEKAFPAAQVRMGDYHLEGTFLPHDPPAAVKLFEQAAAKNWSPALRKLGWCSENGIGMTKDAAKAFDFYRRSAESGDPLGNYHTGRCFLEGIGVKANASAAFFYFKRSAAGNCREGILASAEALRLGRGCTQNEELSRRLLEKAAEM